MLIALLKYVKPLEEVDAILPAHRSYLDKLLNDGKLLICGRLNPRTGGVIIVKNMTRKELEKSLKTDPLSNTYEFQIIEFIPAMYTHCLKNEI